MIDNERESVRNALSAALSSVRTDEETLDLFTTDIFWSSAVRPLAVVSPRNEEEVALAVRKIAELGLHILPRGGGMSYTKGYLSEHDGAVVLDLRRLNRINKDALDDGYIEVESGCTWAELHAALAGTGFATGYWGPFSGLVSTVGGAVSQNSGGFGSARHGTVAESVLGLRVVLADGTLVSTGSAARKSAAPFSRTNGPDLTGMFLGDNGAFGVKTAIILRLRPVSRHTGFLSFGFPSLTRLALAQCDIARAEAASASYGFDLLKATIATQSMSFGEGFQLLRKIADSKARIPGALAALKTATTGSAFLKRFPFTLHLTLEEDSEARLAERQEQIMGLMAKRNGAILPATVPQALHAQPFGPLRGMLGPDGERWVPVHALFPLSQAPEIIARWEETEADWREILDRHAIRISLLTLTVDRQFFFEPAFYWQDELLPIHKATLGEIIRPEWTRRPPRPGARAAVEEMRNSLQELFAAMGGISWQIARDYPFENQLQPAYWSLLKSVKHAIDPKGVLNPGSLELGVRKAGDLRV